MCCWIISYLEYSSIYLPLKVMSKPAFFQTLSRGLLVLVLGFSASFASFGVAAPSASAVTCALADKVYVNEDPAVGVDRAGCWGYDKTHPYRTLQAAVDYKNSLYTGTETSFPTIEYKAYGTATESVNNATGIPFIIQPYSGSASVSTTFSVQGQNLEFKSFSFTAGGIKVKGTSTNIDVTSNTFNAGSKLDITSKSEVYISGNTFKSAYIYDHSNTGRVSVWGNSFTGAAPNITINYGTYSVNYGNVFVFAEYQTSGGFDFVGNNVSGGQALQMRSSSGAIIMSNTVVGSGVPTDIAFYLFDTSAASFTGNTISSVGTGLSAYGWATTPNVNNVDKNKITLVNTNTTQSTGINLTGVNVNGINSNTVSGGDWALYTADSAVSLVDTNSFSSSSVDFFVYQSDVSRISNNSFTATGKGIYVVKDSTIDTIEKNSFAAGNAGIVMESDYRDFDDWNQEGAPAQGACAEPMNVGANIRNNTFNGTNLGIGLACTQINNVRSNVFTEVDDGVVAYFSSMNKVQENGFTSSQAAGNIAVDLYGSSIAEMVRNNISAFYKGLEMTDLSVVSAKMDGNIFTGGNYGIYIDGAQFGTPVVNEVFTNDQTAIYIANGTVNGFTVLFSTFFGQTAEAVHVGTLLSGSMTLANNVFSYPASVAVFADRTADLGVLNSNLYNAAVSGGTVAQLGGVAYTVAGLQGIGLEATAYEETGTSLRNTGAGDFSLNLISVGINSADAAYGVGTDANNRARPACSGPDRGAYEAASGFGFVADNDGDGLCNFQENAWTTSDASVDTDGDTIGDYDEIYVLRSNPVSTDTDADGMDDGYEYSSTCLDILANDAAADDDGDGVTNGAEYSAGMDPCSNDSDGDGMDDTWETTYGLDPTTDDTGSDLDGDGLSNGEEYAAGTDPSDTDTDGDSFNDYDEVTFGTDPLDASDYPNDGDHDGMDDDWELANGLDSSDAADAAEDADADGLSNLEEYRAGTDPNDTDSDDDSLSDGDEVSTYGTDPLDTDTDGDSYLDGEEVSYGSDPVDAASTPLTLDTDGDGLSDYAETSVYGTDPNDSDTDGDGLTDYEEVITYGTDATLSDTDSDGLSDYEELVTYGTDAGDSDSDSDGLSDGEEVSTYGTDPNLSDTDADTFTDYEEILGGSNPLDAASTPDTTDTDGDGVTDVVEATLGTDAGDSDSDNDGLTDGEEVYTYGSDPLETDTDGDGLSDYEEAVTYGTDASATDSDGDGLSDYAEVITYGTDPLLADTDADGLSDLLEIDTYGTDPNLADSDADGLSDYDEILTYNTDPNDSDTDGDGLSDGDEISTYGTDANDTDTDGDGLSDYDEVITYGTDATVADSDGDGLSDYAEAVTYGTDPLAADSDGDTYSDFDEVAAGSNPLDAGEDPTDVTDTDGDGLFDSEETVLGTDPADADTDGDGLSDGEEVDTYGTDPLVADSDGDTYSDSVEVAAGSNPLNAADDPTTSVDTDGDGLLDSDETGVYGTDPADTDSDDDGLTDYDEVITYLTDANDNDSDDDLFSDGYEVSEVTDALDVSSVPNLTLSFVGYDGIYGYGDSSTWTASTVTYESSLSLEAGLSDTTYVEVYFWTDGAFGVSWNEEEYLGSITVNNCGGAYSSFSPLGASCSSITEFASSSNPDAETTHVSSDSELEAWSYLSTYYTFADWSWYRPAPTPLFTSPHYDAFSITLAP